MKTETVLAVGLLLIAQPLTAQVYSTAPADTSGCGRARVVARSSRSTASIDRALNRLAGCDLAEYGQTLAGVLERDAGSRSSAELETLWRHTRWIRDANVFRSALTVAAEPRNSVAARVHAFRALAMSLDPYLEVSTYAGMLQRTVDPRTGGKGACVFHRTSEGVPFLGVPLPTNARMEVEALTARVAEAPYEPEDVRAAAWCAGHHF
jgi:hypothetical protein